MFGRPVHLLAAAAIASTASVTTISPASAGCFSGCGSYTYAAPVAYYSAPVVYSYSYAAPVSYAAPCNPCGGYGYGYVAPSYVVNQGPAYTQPILRYAEPTPAPPVSYGYSYGGGYPAYSDDGYRPYRYGYRYRSYGYRYGYRHHGYRYGYRPRAFRDFGYRDLRYRGFGHQRYRYGAVVPGVRFGMRQPNFVGPYRGPRARMPGFVQPMRHMGGGVPPHQPMGAMPPRRGGPMHPMMHPMPMKKRLP